jgi:uncharacterized lipoprotein YajG
MPVDLKFVSVFFVAAILLAGCAQPSGGGQAASATPVPQASASVAVGTASPVAKPDEADLSKVPVKQLQEIIDAGERVSCTASGKYSLLEDSKGTYKMYLTKGKGLVL